MTTRTEKIEGKARDLLAELQQTRDEMRLQLHLAGLETKDAFHDLEHKLNKIEARAHEVGDEPAKEVEEALVHLRAAFMKIRAKLKH